jgi:ATP-binding cassette subfamily B protein
MISVSRRVEYDLRNDFFAHLLTLDQPFYDRRPLGDLMARATNDLNSIRMLLGPGIMYSINIAATLTFALALMIAIDGRLTAISLLPLPGLSLLIYFVSKRMHHGYRRVQERFSQITALVQQNFSGIRVVKAFQREDAEAERFAAGNEQYRRDSLRVVRLTSLFFPSMQLFSGAAVILVLLFGGRFVIAGSLSLGDIVAFIQYIGLLTWPMMALGWTTGILQQGSSSWQRLLEIMDTQPAIASPPAPGPAPAPGPGRLSIRGLSFSYGDRDILRGIDLELAPGESLGIIGPTGGGKSTLLKMIPRLLDTPSGCVFLDGEDVTTMPLERLRGSIGWVSQEPLLFSETLEENLRFGRPDASVQERDRAAQDAAVLDEIMAFPAAWDTLIGERGVNLSGGQKQRVSLARALLSERRLLLLDAPFASVDTHTEERILQALEQQRGRRTLILVSHRVSTVRAMDRICVLADGRIIEQGDHASLLASGGLYARFHEQQLLEESLRAQGQQA